MHFRIVCRAMRGRIICLLALNSYWLRIALEQGRGKLIPLSTSLKIRECQVSSSRYPHVWNHKILRVRARDAWHIFEGRQCKLQMGQRPHCFKLRLKSDEASVRWGQADMKQCQSFQDSLLIWGTQVCSCPCTNY